MKDIHDKGMMMTKVVAVKLLPTFFWVVGLELLPY